jgi:phosphatidylinositol alpha-1,6-mannosyltransferase
MSDKKVLLLTSDFPPKEGGVARYLRALAGFFHDQIEVVCDPDEHWQEFDPMAGYPIFRRELLSKSGIMRWRKSVSFLREFKDRYRAVIVSHVLPFGTAAWIASKFTKLPYIVIVHGMDIRLASRTLKKKWIAKKVLTGARVVVANSNALAQEVADTFGLKQVLVVYPCVSDCVLTKRDMDQESFRLLTVSRLVERKGHVCVLNALALLKQSGKLGKIRYDIVGDGPMEGSLKSIVDELGLTDCVAFLGRVSDEKRGALFSGADLFVMPVSNDPVDKEGFGLVYIEAASHGVASVATRVAGVDEAVIDGQTGILLDGQDANTLASVILQLVNDSQLRERLGLGAFAHAKKFVCGEQMEKLRPFL